MFDEVFKAVDSAFAEFKISHRNYSAIVDMINCLSLPKGWNIFGHGSEKIVLENEQYPNFLLKIGNGCVFTEIETYKELSEKLPKHVPKYYMFGKLQNCNFAICEKIRGTTIKEYDWSIGQMVRSLLDSANIQAHFEYGHAPNILLGNDGNIKFVDLS